MKKQLSFIALILTTAISSNIQSQEMPIYAKTSMYQVGVFSGFSKQRLALTPKFIPVFDDDTSKLYGCFSGLKADYSIGDRVAVVAKLGTYSQKYKIDNDNYLAVAKFKDAFGYELGCKVNLYERDCLKVFLEPTYFRAKAKAKEYNTLYRQTGIYVHDRDDGTTGRIHQKFASSLCIQGQCHSAQLYGGVRLAYDRIHNLDAMTSPIKQLRAKNAQKIGMTAGCRLSLTDKCGLNVEGRAFDENAVSGNIYFNY